MFDYILAQRTVRFINYFANFQISAINNYYILGYLQNSILKIIFAHQKIKSDFDITLRHLELHYFLADQRLVVRWYIVMTTHLYVVLGGRVNKLPVFISDALQVATSSCWSKFTLEYGETILS